MPLFYRPVIAQSAVEPQSQVYRLKYRPVAEVERPLKEALASLGLPVQLSADAAGNQFLVRGPERAHVLARQFLAGADRPSGETPPSGPVLRAYLCATGRQAEAAERLRTIYAARNDLRISADPSAPQLYVFAPLSLQAEIAGHLAASGLGPVQATAPQAGNPPSVINGGPLSPEMTPDQVALPRANRLVVPPAAGDLRADGQAIDSKSLRLAHVRMEEVEGMLRQWLAQRLAANTVTMGSGQPDYVYTDAVSRRVEIYLDRSQNTIAFRGPEGLVRQFVRLMQSVDQPAQAGQARRILPVRRADPAKVQEAVRAYREGSPKPSPDQSGDERFPNGKIDLVGYLFQQTPGDASRRGGRGSASARAAQSAGKAAEPIPAQEPLDEAVRRQLRALGSEVEVEVLPDLDVVILRGREQDVDEVTRIVEELERISQEAQPSIDVVDLKHVGSEAVTALISRVNDAVVGGRQGRVSIMPLSKPNAILLIGWGEALAAMRELIQKLDQPVAPDTQFQVFSLRYAPASTLRTTVQEHFANRVGLSGRVVVSADTRTNTLIVQAPPREMTEVSALIEGLDRGQSAAVNQTRLFRLTHSLAVDLATTLQAAIDASRGVASATAAAAGQKSSILELITLDPQGQRIIKSGILADVRITPDPRLNTLLVTAPAESMELLAALIQQLDQPVSAAQIKVFRVINGDASTLVNMLRALLFRTDTAGGPQLSVNPEDESLAPLRFSVDVRTNSIIVVGSVGDLRIIEALLLRLDEQEMQRRRNAVYRLKNAPALDVATAINEFLRSKRQVAQALPGAVSPYEQIESEVVVVPEPVSNSLILSASPRFFDEVSELVEKLDAEPPKVLIQVLIAQVDLSHFNEFGMELGLQDSVLFDRSSLSSLTSNGTNLLSSTLVPGVNFVGQALGNSGPNALNNRTLPNYSAVGGQATSSFNMGRANSELSYGGLVLSASSESVSVLIRALETAHCLEVLSRPQVMTLDNQPAYIQVGQRVPRIQGTAVNVNGSVNSVVLENVGLILAVTPRISPDGMVVMEVDAEKSDVGPEADGIPVSISNNTVIRSPKINVTTAQTTVSASSGETVVLGGLITKSTETTERKVPWLGDIPILGNFFKYSSHDVGRTELLIVLTPHVVRTREDAERAKHIEAARLHWCLRDVQQLHGDIGVNGVREVPAASGAPVIYPDRNPRGLLPGGPVMQREQRLDTIPELLPGPASEGTMLQWPAAPRPNGGQPPTADPRRTPSPSAPTDSQAMNLPWQDDWAPSGFQRSQFGRVEPAGYAEPSNKLPASSKQQRLRQAKSL